MERGGKAKEKYSLLLVLLSTNSSISGLSKVSEHGILKSMSFVLVLIFLPGYFPGVSIEVGAYYGSQHQQIENNTQL